MGFKWSAAVVAASLVATSVSFGAERATFVDVGAGDWFVSGVEACVENGLMEGVGEGRFAPEKVLSVEEALVLAARITWKVDGGVGELPAGGSPEELIEVIYPREDPDVFQIEMEKFQNMKERWSWDGVFYITKRFREVYGPGMTYWYQLDDAATREQFFNLLSLPVKLAELPTVNEVEQIPDAEARGEYDGELVYRLYEAGIVTGVDEYGFAALGASLTRAEAAAMAARVLDPELRVTGYAPSPLPTEGYTLTYLADGTSWLTYPLVLVEPTDVESYFLTLDGKRVDWPEGTEQGVPSFGLDTRGDFVYLQPWDRSDGDYWATKMGLMDREGKMAFPFERSRDLRPTGDGHFIRTVEAVSETEYSKTDVFLLSADGTVEAQLPSYYGTPTNDWQKFNEGVCPWWDKATGLWGYVDAQGNWVVEPVFIYAEKFLNGLAVVEDQDMRLGLMDRQGEMVIPFGDYEDISPFHNSPDYEGPEGLIWFRGPEGSGWMDKAGHRIPGGKALEGQGIFRNGYASCRGVYFNAGLSPVSQKFDWAGQIGPDGRGFVGLDGKIYCIQFE